MIRLYRMLLSSCCSPPAFPILWPSGVEGPGHTSNRCLRKHIAPVQQPTWSAATCRLVHSASCSTLTSVLKSQVCDDSEVTRYSQLSHVTSAKRFDVSRRRNAMEHLQHSLRCSVVLCTLAKLPLLARELHSLCQRIKARQQLAMVLKPALHTRFGH